MTHDTSKDPRLLVAELALSKIKRTIVLKLGIRPKLSKDETNNIIKTLESTLMTCKYMYLEPAELADSEQVKEIVDNAKMLHDSLQEIFEKKDTNPNIKADLHWVFMVLEGLPERLRRGGESLASGVDLMAVKVRNVVKKDKLWVTRVDNGRRELTVVTNMPGIESGDVLAAAFLEPSIFAGTISEAMFLGKDKRVEPVGSFITEEKANVKEASGIIHRQVN
jgi:predicted RNA-binding protein with EMAP domain